MRALSASLGNTVVLERSRVVWGHLSGGCSSMGDAHPWGNAVPRNCRCCQPTSRQLHMAPGVSKHQPHFRAHTHPWCARKCHQRKEREGGGREPPWHLQSEPSAVPAVRTNPAPSSLNGWILNTLLGLQKGRVKVSVFQVPAPSSCPFHSQGTWVWLQQPHSQVSLVLLEE